VPCPPAHPSTNDKQYICPGEIHPISQSVHLARLAAFYPPCRGCAVRHETGQLSAATVDRINSTSHRSAEARLFAAEGVRGIHLNELNRTKAGRLASAFGELAWNSMPAIGRVSRRQRMPERRRPTLVVARDDRVGSPDIMVGVIAALLRTGCDVVDIGEATHAITEFAIEHLNVTGGIIVSGSGYGPSWVGMDFYTGPYRVIQQTTQTDHPKSDFRTSLQHIERQCHEPHCRQGRDAGRTRTFLARVPYEAGLLKHFETSRTRVCVASSRKIVRDSIVAASGSGDGLTLIELPVRPRQLNDRNDIDFNRLAAYMTDKKSAFGLLIDDDGQRCAVLDHTGELLHSQSVLAILADTVNATRPGSSVVVEESAYPQVRDILCDHPCYVAGESAAEVRRAMQQHGASVAGGNSQRYWLEGPRCDAIITLAFLLQAVSRSSRPLRSLADEIEFDHLAA
jgi:phosphomannomutase